MHLCFYVWMHLLDTGNEVPALCLRRDVININAQLQIQKTWRCRDIFDMRLNRSRLLFRLSVNQTLPMVTQYSTTQQAVSSKYFYGTNVNVPLLWQYYVLRNPLLNKFDPR